MSGLTLRPATPADVPAIEAALGPEIAAGRVMPRATIDPAVFVVATAADRVVGCVALDPVDAAVAELGALVACERGLGIGRALVEAALARAETLGHTQVVALTAAPAFFQRCGFTATPERPWLLARDHVGLPSARPLSHDLELLGAMTRRAVACARCPRLARCRQALMVRSTEAVAARRLA